MRNALLRVIDYVRADGRSWIADNFDLSAEQQTYLTEIPEQDIKMLCYGLALGIVSQVAITMSDPIASSAARPKKRETKVYTEWSYDPDKGYNIKGGVSISWTRP